MFRYVGETSRSGRNSSFLLGKNLEQNQARMNDPLMVVLVSSCFHVLVHIVKSFPPWFDIDGCPLVNKPPNPSNQLHME